MSRKNSCLLLVAAVLCGNVAIGAVLPHNMWRSSLGSARLAVESHYANQLPHFYGMFDVPVPAGEWTGLTLCGWFRVMTTNESRTARDFWRTTSSFYCPSKIVNTGPDIFEGLFWHGTEGGFFDREAMGFVNKIDAPKELFLRDRWPNGVVTVDGWSDEVIEISVGGEDYLFGPGPFNRNCIAGPTRTVILTGHGRMAVGATPMYVHQFFGAVDGVSTGDWFLTATSCVTNEYAFCVWRVELNEVRHLYRSDLWQYDNSDQVGQLTDMGLPADGNRRISSAGKYQFGISGLGKPSDSMRYDLFDIRVFPRWLSDGELLRIHTDGVTEMQRRGIPRWRGR